MSSPNKTVSNTQLEALADVLHERLVNLERSHSELERSRSRLEAEVTRLSASVQVLRLADSQSRQSQSDPTIYRCEDCSFATDNIGQFVKHQSEHVNRGSNREEKEEERIPIEALPYHERVRLGLVPYRERVERLRERDGSDPAHRTVEEVVACPACRAKVNEALMSENEGRQKKKSDGGWILLGLFLLLLVGRKPPRAQHQAQQQALSPAEAAARTYIARRQFRRV